MRVTRGFTLLEVLAVLALILVLGSLIMPNFRGRSDKYERELFVEQMNGLVQAARHHAMISVVPHRVVFKLHEKVGQQWIEKAWIEQDTKKKDRHGEAMFEKVDAWRDSASIKGNPRFRIRQFKIDGYDELTRFAERLTGQVYFHVVPDGFTQEVSISVVDSGVPGRRVGRQLELELNPFTGRFTMRQEQKR